MNETTTCIIVDDEPKARKVLSRLIEINCPDLEIIATCQSITEARSVMIAQQPGIVFLDIQLPGSSGFELIEGLPERSFAVIFTTAFEEHAVRAFDHYAQDYLVKPVHSDRLKNAVQKAKDFLQRSKSKRLSDAGKTTGVPRKKLEKIALPISTGIELVPPSEILRFQGSGSYSEVYMLNGDMLVLSQNLKRMEELVAESGFFRVHRSHLINLRYVKRFIHQDGGFIELEDGTNIEVSRRKMPEFKALLGFP